MMQKNDDLYKWLEGSCTALAEANPVSAALVAALPNGNVLTAYYKADATDKALFAHNINADALLDTVVNNIEIIRDALDDLNDDDLEEE